jgi:hypothetical protein
MEGVACPVGSGDGAYAVIIALVRHVPVTQRAFHSGGTETGPFRPDTFSEQGNRKNRHSGKQRFSGSLRLLD